MSDQFIPHAPRDSYRPSPQRGVELKSRPLPGVNYQDAPAAGTEAPSHDGMEGDLEATRVPSGSHKGKTLLQMLNDHPGYLLHLRDEAFTDNEAFELKVEEFCAKYQHRLDRATGGAQSSILWAASIAAFRNSKHLQAHAAIGVWVHEVIVIYAVDHNQAEMLAFAEAQAKFPAPEHQDHASSVLNIPLAQIRNALRVESPGGKCK